VKGRRDEVEVEEAEGDEGVLRGWVEVDMRMGWRGGE
jgi:hypothetical protein